MCKGDFFNSKLFLRSNVNLRVLVYEAREKKKWIFVVVTEDETKE